MKRYADAVTLFHQRQGLGVGVPWTPKLEILRRHLIHEELAELELAWYRTNIAEVMDAVGDLMYVIAGTAVQFGYSLPPGISSIWLVKKNLGDHRVNELSADVSCGMIIPHMSEDDVERMLGTVIRFAHQMDLPYDEIFDRVQAANMTKAPRTGDERVSDKGASFVPPVYDDLVKVWVG